MYAGGRGSGRSRLPGLHTRRDPGCVARPSRRRDEDLADGRPRRSSDPRPRTRALQPRADMRGHPPGHLPSAPAAVVRRAAARSRRQRRPPSGRRGPASGLRRPGEIGRTGSAPSRRCRYPSDGSFT
jgi:hypothetical protein